MYSVLIESLWPDPQRCKLVLGTLVKLGRLMPDEDLACCSLHLVICYMRIFPLIFISPCIVITHVKSGLGMINAINIFLIQ